VGHPPTGGPDPGPDVIGKAEQEGDKGWEVGLLGPDGSELEVYMDGNFKVVGSEVEEDHSEDPEYGGAGMSSGGGEKAAATGPTTGMDR
jgi:hypothetical protein